MKNPSPVRVRIEVEKIINVELSEETGVIQNASSTYRFNRADKLDDLISDISLFFLISKEIGNVLFPILENWVEIPE